MAFQCPLHEVWEDESSKSCTFLSTQTPPPPPPLLTAETLASVSYPPTFPASLLYSRNVRGTAAAHPPNPTPPHPSKTTKASHERDHVPTGASCILISPPTIWHSSSEPPVGQHISSVNMRSKTCRSHRCCERVSVSVHNVILSTSLQGHSQREVLSEY